MFGFTAIASAVSIFDVEYPVAELGGCEDQAACKAYCDDPANAEACLAFARKFELVDEQILEQAEHVREAARSGPGGCDSEASCRAYCEDFDHADECNDFAADQGLISREEAERNKKLSRPGPGGCRGDECRVYCEDAAHQDECFEFAVENGFINEAEAERIRNLKSRFKELESESPGGCRGEQECRAYCEDPDHIDECLEFGRKHGFVSEEQASQIKKIGAGGGPGGCRGAQQCKAYCDEPGHEEECLDFGEKHGLIPKEDAERFRKVIAKPGPGGCRGRQCEQVCNQPGNEEVCLEFAEQEGLIPKEEVQRARKFLAASRDGGPGGCRGRQCEQFCQDPAHGEECFDFAKKEGLISPEEEKQFEAGIKLQQVVQQSGGPGGCRSDEECRTYCADAARAEECVAFGAAHAGIPEEQVRAMLKQFTDQRIGARKGFGPPQDFDRFQEGALKRFEEFRQLEQQFRGGEGGFNFPGAPGEFPGAPGEFPGQGFGPPPGAGFPGGGAGGGAFAGPGGCAGPQECIKYCTEHREECFSSGPPGQGGPQTSEGGFPGRRGSPSFGPPRLRGGLIQKISEEDLPPDFQQLPAEERRRFIQERFSRPQGEEGEFHPPGEEDFGREGEQQGGGFPSDGPPQQFPGRPGTFPGRPPQGFPGGPGEFPGAPGLFPARPPEGFPGTSGEFHLPPEGQNIGVPLPNVGPVPGTPGILSPLEHQIQQEFQQQTEQQVQQQIQQQTQQQIQQQFQQIAPTFSPPPEGSFTPPPTFSPPPDSFTHPPDGSFTSPPPTFSPPPTGSFSSPPPTFSPPPESFSQPPPPPPQGLLTPHNLLGLLLGIFLGR
ncbi:MAG: hypothetical protein HY472_01740 [Candidatus Sungbacteria bacterium]|nr:hypothetical protein [Candidatus Sungbacteria bacterium]